MDRFEVTEENWNDDSFWSFVRSAPDDTTLSFSALGALFNIALIDRGESNEKVLVLSNGPETFVIGGPDATDVDATIGGEGGVDAFSVLETSEDGAQITELPDQYALEIEENETAPEDTPEEGPDSGEPAQNELHSAETGSADSDASGGAEEALNLKGTLDTSHSQADHQAIMDGGVMGVAQPGQAVEVTSSMDGTQVVVIDCAVEDAASLAAAFGPDVQVILLDPTKDGVAQIAEALEGQSDIDGLHILSHGAEGHLQLGSTLLDAEGIAGAHAEDLAKIGASLSDAGDILLYGCNFGEGEDGAAAMEALASATMGDIAASDDRTGAAALDADWELEVTEGTVETEALEIEGWNHVMANWYGTSGNDSLLDYYTTYSYVYGYGGADSLHIGNGTVYGGDGNDNISTSYSGHLYGESGDDNLWGVASSIVSGGTGTDTLITSNAIYAITVDLNDTSWQEMHSGHWATITGIENITSGNDADELQGNDDANVFYSNAGDDTVSGDKGDDSIYAGDGADGLYGGSGADVLHGEDGADLIRGDNAWYDPGDYASGSGSSTTLTINNDSGETITIYWIDGSGTLNYYGTISDGGTFSNSTFVNHNWMIRDSSGYYREIIQVTGATTVNYDAADLGDTINGGAGNDTIYGESGDDYIDGGTDDDLIYGGVGDDTVALSDGFGTDTAYGEGGSGDYLDAMAMSTGVTVTFTDGEDGTLTDGTNTVTFDNFEEFRLTGSADSVDGSLANASMYVLGGAGNDTITGGSAGDTIDGGDDDDVIDGGDGDDSLVGGAGDDSLIAGNNTGAGDTLEGGSGSDTLVDSYGNATLDGGDDADLFKLGYGSATITGGEGGTDADTISFQDANDAVDITLSGASEAGTYTDSDGDSGSFTEIEAFELSENADTFNSGAITGVESVYGMGGDDTITTKAGADYIDGGTGADSIVAGQGADTILGGDGNDYISGQSEDDSILAGSGDDTVLGGQHNDTIDGGADNDSLEGEGGDDSIIGGTGDDTIAGGFGSDTLTGGDGEDVFEMLAWDGRDTITDFDIADDDTNGFFNDQLDVTGLTGGTGPAGAIRAQDVVVTDDGSGNAILAFPNGEELLLQGVAPASISGGPNLFSAGIPCFTPTVRIATARGMVPAGEIRVGDLLQTADNGYQPVLWCGRRQLSTAELIAHPHLTPVLLQSSSLLGNDRPVLVSPQHRFLLPKALRPVRDHFLRAKLLPDLPFSRVRRARGMRAVTYVHLMTPRHEVIFAEGLATETFWPGAEALRSLTPMDRREIALLFPELLRNDMDAGARCGSYGEMARKDLRRSDLRERGLLHS